MAELIKSNGDTQEITPKNGKSFTLEEVYKLLTCETVEVIPLPKKRYMIIDEEGKLKPNPVQNFEGTYLLHQARGISDDYIVGDVIICETKQFK